MAEITKQNILTKSRIPIEVSPITNLISFSQNVFYYRGRRNWKKVTKSPRPCIVNAVNQGMLIIHSISLLHWEIFQFCCKSWNLHDMSSFSFLKSIDSGEWGQCLGIDLTILHGLSSLKGIFKVRHSTKISYIENILDFHWTLLHLSWVVYYRK